MRINSVILILFLSFYSNLLISQNSENVLIIDNKIHFGKVLNYFQGREGFPKRKVAIANEFYVGYKTQGKENWHNLYNLPEVGISFITKSLGNKKQLGYGFGLIPNITTHLFKIKNQTLKFRIGLGIGYYTNPYNSVSNPENIIIGNHLMNMSFYAFIYQHKLSDKIHLNLALTFLHGSNGHFQIPNGGVNIPTASIGVKYYLKKITEFANKEDRIKVKNKFRINFSAGIGTHEFGGTTGPIGTPKYHIYSGSLFLSKFVGYRSNLFAGISAKHYKSYYHYIENDSILSENRTLNASVLTLFIGQEFIIKRIGFFITGGYNFFRPALHKLYKERENNALNYMEEHFSMKMGFRFFAFKPHDKKRFNPYFGLAIKAKYTNADYPELSCGIVF